MRQHVQVRTQARRRLLAAFVMPALILALLGVSSLTIYLVVESNSMLTSGGFNRLEKGQTRDEAYEILPSFQMFDPPTELGLTDLPEGAECEYYPSRRETIDFVDVYEVCFADDVLITKHVITSEERRLDLENSYGG